MNAPASVILDLLVEQGLLSADQIPSLRRELAASKDPLERLLQMGILKPQQATSFGDLVKRRARKESASELARNLVEGRPLLEDEDSASRPPVLGRYDLLNALGKGGGGTVYRALDRELDRIVAVKRVPFGNQARFLREAKTTARLQHPHIVPIFDMGSDEEACYLILQYIEGHNLPDWIQATQPDFAEIARAIQEASEAISFAHEQHVLHRDLKPDNLLVDSQGKTFVTDFGIALQTDASVRLTHTGTLLGTPMYMSPEQAEGKPERMTERSDVYSLGATLYYALTRRPPFRGDTLSQVLSEVLHRDPPPPRSLNPAIPADLETICLKAMEKEPPRRYRTARDLAADLARFRAGAPIAARPPSTIYRLRKWARRRRTALLAVASVLVFSLATGGLLWKVSRARSFQEAGTQARKSYDERDWPKALVFCEQALKHRDDAALAQMAEECRTRIAAEESARRLRERIAPFQEKIAVTESQRYVRDLDIAPRLKSLEEELERLAQILEEPAHQAHSDGWRVLGYGWYVVGDRKRSAQALEKSVALSPRDPKANSILAKVYLEFSMELYVEAEFRPPDDIRSRAQAWTRKALERIAAAGAGGGSDAMDRQIAQAYRALAEEKNEEVHRLCDDGLRQFGSLPGTEEFWNLKGWILHDEKGIEAYDKALERCPQYAWGHFMRGHLRHIKEDTRGAEEDYTAALRLNLRLLLALNFRGLARLMEGRYDEAIPDFTEAIRSDPAYDLAYHYRAAARAGRHDWDGAIADYSDVIRLSPSFREAYQNRGNLRGDRANRLHEMGRVAEAIQEWGETIADYSRVIQLDSKSARAHYNLGGARDSRGDLLWSLERTPEAVTEWKLALEDYTAAIGLDRAFADAWNNRAVVKFKLEDFEGSIADCSAALSIEPNHLLARFNRGRSYLRKGDRGNAEKDLTEVLTAAPPDWPTRREAEELSKELRP